MIDSEGLRGFVDVKCLQNELSEATGLSSNEMDEAAHQLMTSQTGAREPSTATESDRESNDSLFVANRRPNGDLHEYEFSV